VMSFRQVCTIIEGIFVVKEKIKTIHRDMNAPFATLQCIDGCFRVYDTIGSFSTKTLIFENTSTIMFFSVMLLEKNFLFFIENNKRFSRRRFLFYNQKNRSTSQSFSRKNLSHNSKKINS